MKKSVRNDALYKYKKKEENKMTITIKYSESRERGNEVK